MFIELHNGNNDTVSYILKDKVIGVSLEVPRAHDYFSIDMRQLRIDCRGGKSYYSGWLPLDQAEALKNKVINELNK